MKIAILAHTMHPIRKPFYGGLEMHTYLLCEQLQKRGHDVTLFAAKGSDPKFKLVEIIKPRGIEDNSKWQKATLNGSRYYRQRKLEAAYYEAMRKIISGDFDLVHNNTLNPLPLKYASNFDVPMLTVLHTPPLKELKKYVSGASEHSRQRIVTVSHNNASAWQDATGFRPEVIYNGVEVRKWHYKTQMPDHKFAVWVGRITPEKGLDYAIEACQKANIDLKIIGPISDSEYFENKIQPTFNDHITYYGHLSHEIINHIVLTSSVLIISSVWEEPFGLVVAEALAMGTPVAGFRIGALPEIITSDVGELARVRDCDDLAKAIIRAMTKDPLKCRELVKEHFSVEQMIDKYEAIYARLAAHVPETSVENISWATENI